MVCRTVNVGGTPAPYRPTAEEWGEVWEMLCGHCARSSGCEIVEGMIEMKNGAPWPLGGWITDPGAGVSCLSYRPKQRRPMPRQQLRRLMRLAEHDLPPVCGGCAARRGSDASVSLHTRRDYTESVRTKALFVCHEDPDRQRLCGGWCRAIRQRKRRAALGGGKH